MSTRLPAQFQGVASAGGGFSYERAVGLLTLQFSWDGGERVEVSLAGGPVLGDIYLGASGGSRPDGQRLSDFAAWIDRWVAGYPEDALFYDSLCRLDG